MATFRSSFARRFFLLIFASGFAVMGALAAGPKAPGRAPGDSAPPLTAAKPLRHVVVRSVTTKPFTSPNGAQVDLTADLAGLMNSAVTSSPLFAPTDSAVNEICDKHLEISAAITVLELKVASLGISFGFTPSGEIHSPVTSATGKAQVNIGTLAMDFGVWECDSARKACTEIIESEVNQPVDSLDLSFEVDFGMISVKPEFIVNTALGNAIRKMMNRGVALLASSDRVQELPWMALVRKYSPDSGTLVLDAGFQSRLSANQELMVYAVNPTTGVCSVYERVAYVHTTAVDPVSSIAQVDQIFDGQRGIHEGDLVMVRAVGSP